MKRILVDINQHLKTFDNEYVFIKNTDVDISERDVFLVKDKDLAFGVIYETFAIDDLGEELFENSFKINDAKELYAFLKAAKEVSYVPETESLENELGILYKIKILTSIEIKKELKGKFGYILSNLKNITVNPKIIDGDNSKLIVNDIELCDTITSANILDALSNEIKLLSDHRLCFAEIENNKLSLYPEFSRLDLTKKILVLPHNVFRKLKTLKNDSSYFDIYLSDNGVVVKYGVDFKENLSLVFNILYNVN